MNKAYALIMAGGAGTRLWPLSRQNQPKPLITLVDQQRSMFQIAVERLSPLFAPEQILVVANSELTKQLQAQALHIPGDNFIIEPMGRDTAPAVGLGAIHIRHRNPEAVMAVLTADHYIADEDTFRQALEAGISLAAEGKIVMLGIEPTYPATGFGYIERGEPATSVKGVTAYNLEQFKEKPDPATAEAYLRSGKYSWNSGMFIWPVKRVMAEFATHAPDIHDELERLAAAIGQPGYNQLIANLWPGIRKTSVDYALMEHIESDVYVIPVEMGWQDIGNFSTLYDILSAGSGNNVTHAAEPPLLIDTNGTLIFSRRLVAAIGVDDLVIVDTDDVLLVCRRDLAQDVKKIVEQLKMENRDRYL